VEATFFCPAVLQYVTGADAEALRANNSFHVAIGVGSLIQVDPTRPVERVVLDQLARVSFRGHLRGASFVSLFLFLVCACLCAEEGNKSFVKTGNNAPWLLL
jgi:hypothetical protein